MNRNRVNTCCSGACGWCGACTEAWDRTFERTCSGCGFVFHLRASEPYLVQVFCARCIQDRLRRPLYERRQPVRA